MKKNIKTKKQKKPRATRQKQKQKQSVNVKVNIDQSKRSINKPPSKSNKQSPYIPIPPIMINPSTQTNPQINPFSFSDIKDVVRNVLGESINNRQASVQFVGEEMQNPYGMKTPGQNTSSKLYESIPKSEDETTFGDTYQNKIYPISDDYLDYIENQSTVSDLSSIFPNLSNEQTLTKNLNTPEEVSSSRDIFGLSPISMPYNDEIMKNQIKKQEKEIKRKEIDVTRGFDQIQKFEKKKEQQKQQEEMKNIIATSDMSIKELRGLYWANFKTSPGKMSKDNLIYKINTSK